jgi:hypothetical protein
LFEQILLANLIHSLGVATHAAGTSTAATSAPEIQMQARSLIEELTGSDQPLWRSGESKDTVEQKAAAVEVCILR